jgi:hypothetical protein
MIAFDNLDSLTTVSIVCHSLLEWEILPHTTLPSYKEQACTVTFD